MLHRIELGVVLFVKVHEIRESTVLASFAFIRKLFRFLKIETYGSVYDHFLYMFLRKDSCICVFVCIFEVRRGYGIPWNWSYGKL